MNLKNTLILSIISLFTSCYYDAPFSTKDNSQFDKKILGVWHTQDKSHPSLNFSEVLILKSEENEIIVKVLEKGEHYYFTGFTFKLSNHNFIQLKFIGAGDGRSFEELKEKTNTLKKYVLVKYEFIEKQISIQLINDKIIPTTVSSQKELSNLLKSNLESKELFGFKCLFEKE